MRTLSSAEIQAVSGGATAQATTQTNPFEGLFKLALLPVVLLIYPFLYGVLG
ncbi:MAG: hypothetical protein RI907_2762 [Pseudomonadota bacterium]|jgi:hypothetical protein